MHAKVLSYAAAILVLLVLITVHEFGHFLVAKLLRVPVRVFSIGFGKALVSWRWNETEMRLAAFPVGGFCAFADDEDGGENARPDELLRNRPIGVQAAVVSAGVAFNYVFAFLVLLTMVMSQGYIPGTRHVPPTVQQVLAGPAQRAGVTDHDQVLAVSGVPVRTTQEFIAKVSHAPGQRLDLEILRAGRQVHVPVVPNASGRIGVVLSDVEETRQPIHGPSEVVGSAAQLMGAMTVNAIQSPYLLLTGQVPLSEVGGVVAITDQTARIAQQDYRNLFPLTALISIALAVFNFLPFPALDGGHFVFLVIGAIRRRPVPPRIVEPINQAGLVVLLGLMGLLLVKDVHQLITREGATPAAHVAAPSKGTAHGPR